MTDTGPATTATGADADADEHPGTGEPVGRRRAVFHPLEVSEVRRLTKDSVEVGFAVPEELVEEYDYAPGQYVALRKQLPDADGALQEVRRSYSICAEPQAGRLRIAIKRDLGGQFSTWANDHLAVGETIDVMSPSGAFISKHRMTGLNHPEQIDTSVVHTFVAVAAGSGITPIMAIARTVLAANPAVRFDLIYSNRAAMDVMFLDELADLKDRYPDRFAVHHVLTREQRISPLLSGRIDAEKLTTLLTRIVRPETVDEWFLCGPFELVQMVRDELEDLGVEPEKVRYELFTTGKPTSPEGHVGRPVEVDDTGDNLEISFRLDGLEGQVASPRAARETILNAALRVRQDVPFACAGGVCGTCRAKLVEGEVEMEENFALEPEEIEQGYVLTCQSHPTTDAVRVDYDA